LERRNNRLEEGSEKAHIGHMKGRHFNLLIRGKREESPGIVLKVKIINVRTEKIITF